MMLFIGVVLTAAIGGYTWGAIQTERRIVAHQIWWRQHMDKWNNRDEAGGEGL